MQVSRNIALLGSSWRVFQPLVHDEGVDETVLRVIEGFGQYSDDLEAEGLPKTHGTFIARCYKVELHRPVSELSGHVQGVTAHLGG